MKTLILLSFQFYRLLLLFNIASTLLAIMLVWVGFGHIDGGILFLAKVLGFCGAVILHQYSAKETYFYFRNAGYRMRQIVGVAFIIDVGSYFAALLLVNVITYVA